MEANHTCNINNNYDGSKSHVQITRATHTRTHARTYTHTHTHGHTHGHTHTHTHTLYI